MKSRKKLTKAQDGIITGPTRGTDYAPPLKDKNIYAGPLTERDTKALNERYPGTAGGNTPSYIPEGKTKNGYVSPKGVEQYRRNMDENYLRSMDPAVQKWNANQNYDGEFYPTTKNIEFKNGGSVIKGSQLRRQASTKGLRTSRKHK